MHDKNMSGPLSGVLLYFAVRSLCSQLLLHGCKDATWTDFVAHCDIKTAAVLYNETNEQLTYKQFRCQSADHSIGSNSCSIRDTICSAEATNYTISIAANSVDTVNYNVKNTNNSVSIANGSIALTDWPSEFSKFSGKDVNCATKVSDC